MNGEKIKKTKTKVLPLLFLICFIYLLLLCSQTALAGPSTSLTISKIASDGKTVLAEKTVDYHWLMDEKNIPVLGDGTTHYYHQGPVFVDDEDEATEEKLRWNSEEDINVEDKDMGALQGNNLKDLCDLVGGMEAGDTIKIKAADGLSKTFAYENVYSYSQKEGPMVICWYKDGMYPDSGYSEGMRLVWFADTSTNPWGYHVFGNWDWHEAADAKYWYYYQSADEKYPTTTGLSVQNVAELIIYSSRSATEDSPQQASSLQSADTPAAEFTADTSSGYAPLTVRFVDCSSGSPSSWTWDFDDDGKTDSWAQNPSFTYDNPGTYSVGLIVGNASGEDKEIKSSYIKVYPAPSTEAAAETPADASAAQTSWISGNGANYLPLTVIIIIAVCVGAYLLIRRQKKSK